MTDPSPRKPNTTATIAQFELSATRVSDREGSGSANRDCSQARPQRRKGCNGDPLSVSARIKSSRALLTSLGADRPSTWSLTCEQGQGRYRKCASVAWAGASGLTTSTGTEPLRLHNGSRNASNARLVPANDPANGQGSEASVSNSSAYAAAFHRV